MANVQLWNHLLKYVPSDFVAYMTVECFLTVDSSGYEEMKFKKGKCSKEGRMENNYILKNKKQPKEVGQKTNKVEEKQALKSKVDVAKRVSLYF